MFQCDIIFQCLFSGDKLGGYVFWYHEQTYPTCKLCKQAHKRKSGDGDEEGDDDMEDVDGHGEDDGDDEEDGDDRVGRMRYIFQLDSCSTYPKGQIAPL